MWKSMLEIETEIKNDLTELEDQMSQYTFIVECGLDLPDYPKQYRTDEYLIRECQVQTWICAIYEENLIFMGDSESLIIRGALSLIREIYNGRSREEVRQFHCTLIEEGYFRKHFTQEQLHGLKAILEKLEEKE